MNAKPLRAVALRRPRGIDPEAVRQMTPIAVGLVPFGLLIGLTLTTHPVGAGPGLLTAALMWGGTAHISALTMISAGADPLAVLAGVVVINARLLLYGAALQSRFAGQPAWFRWLGPAVLIDQTFALASARPADDDPARFRRYWLTAGGVMGVGWLGSHLLGIVVGPVLPAWLPLGIAAPAVLVGLLVPHLRRRTGLAAAVVSGVVAAAAAPLPAGIGTLVGAAAGLVAATLVGRREARS